jgi:hypothetical protein
VGPTVVSAATHANKCQVLNAAESCQARQAGGRELKLAKKSRLLHSMLCNRALTAYVRSYSFRNFHVSPQRSRVYQVGRLPAIGRCSRSEPAQGCC